MDDLDEFVEAVVGELVDSVLEGIIVEMAGEIVCELCFEEDAVDVWEYRC